MAKTLDNIRVAIRVRPLLKRESGCKPNWQVEDNTIFQLNDGKRVPNCAFTFDRIFDQDLTTADLYTDFAKPIVLSGMEGINGTLFAYGQTSSGKTYTMTGDENCPGIIPFALQEVFDYISVTENREFLLRVSYMEIYNEVITDLLKPKHTNLRIHENPQREVFVGDLTEQVVTSPQEIFDLMKIGERNRHFGCTNMNEKSSRSHTIFRMVIESRENTRDSIGGCEVDGAVKVSHLNLVDLAGSERASATGAEGIRLREGGFINKSLFALGNVINKLSEGERTFVPFRDSKLTRILQTSLGGNAKTSIICAVTPASLDETLSTLQFASRAKTIKNRPEVNEVLDETTLLKRYRKEINELKKQLEQFASNEAMMELQIEKDKMEQLLREQREEADRHREKMRELANFFCTAQPKESEKQNKRNKRRWTMCPMAVLNKPALRLDLPGQFASEFVQSSKRQKSGADRHSSSSSSEGIDSDDFNKGNLDRFLAEIEEKEETDEMPSVEHTSRKSNESRKRTVVTFEERRCSLAENVAEERIAELELELRRVSDERDALREERDNIRNDLSENITSSCEVQEDLLKTKQLLKEKKNENQELLGLVEQLESSRENEACKESKEKEILELREALFKEKEMLATTEATFRDICFAKENVEKKLAKYKDDNENLSTKLDAAKIAEEEAASECKRLHKLTQELENKVDLLTVIQGDLEAVDGLQEELSREQDKNSALEEKIREKKDAYQKLREELEQQSEKVAGYERNLADREITFAETNGKLNEVSEKAKLLEEENVQLQSKLRELDLVGKDSDAFLEQLKQRVQELEDQNASLSDEKREIEQKCWSLQNELVENSALVLDMETSKSESSRILEDLVKEKDAEVSELKQKVKKLTRKRRQASIRSSEPLGTLPLESNYDPENNSNLMSLVQELGKRVSMQETESEREELQNVIPFLKNNLKRMEESIGWSEDQITQAEDNVVDVPENGSVVQELAASKSALIEELENVKKELQEKCSTVSSLEAAIVEMEVRGSDAVANLNAKERDRLEMLEKELQETYETKGKLEDELRKAISNSELSKQEHQDKLDSLQDHFNEELKRLNSDLEEKLYVIDELKLKVKEATEVGELVHQESSGIDEKDIGDQTFGVHAALEENPVLEELRQQLAQALTSKEASVKEYEAFIANLQGEINKQLQERDIMLAEKSKEAEDIRKQLQEALASNEALVRDHETKIVVQEQMHVETEERDLEIQEKNDHIDTLTVEFPKEECPESWFKHGERSSGRIGEFEREPQDVNVTLEDKCRTTDELIEQFYQTISNNAAFPEEHRVGITNLLKNIRMELESREKELEAKNIAVFKLKEQLEVISAEKENQELEYGERSDDIRRELDEELKRKNTELREVSSQMLELKEQLQQTLLSKEALMKENEEHIANLQQEFREQLGRIDTELRSNGRDVDIEKLKDELHRKIGVSEQESGEIAESSNEFEHALASKEAWLVDHQERMADLKREFEEELERKNNELQAKAVEVEHLSRQLEEQRLTMKVTDQENELNENEISQIHKNLEDELERRNTEIKEKCETVEQLERQLEQAKCGKEQLQKEHEEFVTDLGTKFEEKLDRMNSELQAKCVEIEQLTRQLNEEKSNVKITPEEDAIDENDLSSDNKESELQETSMAVEEFKEEPQVPNKEQCQKEHEDVTRQRRTNLQEELERKDEELLKEISMVSELQKRLQQEISNREALSENYDTDMARLQETLDTELKKKNSEIEEYDILRKTMDEQLQETICSKQTLVEEHEIYINGLKNEFSEELERMQTTLGEKSNLVHVLEDKLEAAICSQNSLQAINDELTGLRSELKAELDQRSKMIEEQLTVIASLEKKVKDLTASNEELVQGSKDEFSSLKNDLELELQQKNEIIEEKRAQISSLEEQLKNVTLAKEQLNQEHEAFIESLKEEFGSEFQRMNSAIEEKTRMCGELEEENSKVVSEREILVHDHEVLIAGLKKEFSEELERLNGIAEEKSFLVHELEEKVTDKELEYEKNTGEIEELRQTVQALVTEAKELTADLAGKTSRVTDVESELANVTGMRDSLAEKHGNLLSKCKSLEEEINNIRLDLETKSLALEKQKSESEETTVALNQETDRKIEDLQRMNEFLTAECEKMRSQLKEITEVKPHKDDRDERIIELMEQVEQLTKEPDSTSESTTSCRNSRRRGEEGRRRESLLFKSMLEDIKEQCSTENDRNQEKLIDELNHTLMATQEKLEQKMFVIDEKEIEIGEKDALVEELREKLRESLELATTRETKLVELQESSSKEKETAAEVQLELAEAAFQEAKLESEQVIKGLKRERDELQTKIEDYESILSEQQLKEVYETMEKKEKRINELELELNDIPKKEHKICELEMELEIVQSEVHKWKNNSEEAQQSLNDLKEIIKEQEEHIVQLEASKTNLKQKSEENALNELDEVQAELEKAKARLQDFENEKIRGLGILEQKNELLEEYEQVIDDLIEDLRETSEKLKVALQETKEKETEENKVAEEISATRKELEDAREAHKDVSNKLDIATKQLSVQRELASQSEELRKQLSLKEQQCQKEQEERVAVEKVVGERQVECEELKKEIRELRANETRRDATDSEAQTELKKKCAEWENKEKEIASMKERIEFLTGYSEMRDEEYGEVKQVVIEMEDEIDQFKNQVENLESENEELKRRFEETKANSAQPQSREEISSLKSQINALETELKQLRSSSVVDLEQELKKVRGELKANELDLFHAQYESKKQMENAKSRIRELEKDCLSYAKKNNELKSEIRRIRSQDDDTTMQIMNKQQASSKSGDNVGVIGSVALFTLDAKVAKLQEENGELKKKTETVERKNEALNISILDLQQRNSELSEKYNKLKEKFVKTAEAAKPRDDPVPNPKTRDQRPMHVEPMHETKHQEVKFMLNPEPKTVPLRKESHVEKMKKKQTIMTQNKENFLEPDKPDACKTQ